MNVQVFLLSLNTRLLVTRQTRQDLNEQADRARGMHLLHMAESLRRAVYHTDREIELIEEIIADAKLNLTE